METYARRLLTEFEVADTEAVEAYLDKHPSLYDLVMEARREIANRFSPETSVRLDVEDDPEGVEPPELVARIRTDLPAQTARERLAEFDRSWWLENVPRAKGELTIDLQFG